MWVLVTVVGLVVELGVIVLLGRAATRGSEQDLPPRPPRQAAQTTAQTAAPTTAPAGTAARAAAARPPADRPVGGARTVPPAVSRGAHRAAPAARR